jgi:SAM-dependent methyltransferase
VYSDIIDLHDFYAQPLGHVARRMIGHRIRSIWPDVSSAQLIGLGYATPYFQLFKDEATLCAGLMPAAQGVVRWPSEGATRVSLVKDISLPLCNASIDRIIIVHGVESADALPVLLREVWRVLTPSGRLIIVAPNRRGIWARSDTTPFGQGRPFSRSQLSRLLHESMFFPTTWTPALFIPPFRWPWMLRSAVAWERAGRFAWPGFSGVILVEAIKEIYGAIPHNNWRVSKQLNQKFEPAPIIPYHGATPYPVLKAETPPAHRADLTTKDSGQD